jgi:hypothetical protein
MEYMTRLLFLCLGLAGVVSAQAIVERALTSGAAASASGGAKATGDGIGKTLGRAAGALGAAAATGSTASSTQATQAVIAPVEKSDAPPVKVPAADDIKSGMSKEELLKSFGEPTSKMSMAEGKKLVERFRYSDKISYVRVVLEDGKVKEVTSGKNQ